MKGNAALVAGAESGIGRATTLELPGFERVLGVNVVGTFLSSKRAAPAILEAGAGAIVNISSAMGDRAAAGDPSYSTSEHAVRGLTKSAALTYVEQGIRVDSIGPGVVKTGITAPIFENERTTAWLKGVTR